MSKQKHTNERQGSRHRDKQVVWQGPRHIKNISSSLKFMAPLDDLYTISINKCQTVVNWLLSVFLMQQEF